MTDTSVSGVVFPEDNGTGVPEGSEDFDSAGHFGLLSQHQGGAYVGNGLSLTADAANNEVDISQGHAFVQLSSVTVQSGSVESYDTTLPDPVTMVIVIPTSVTLQLDTDVINDIYLATDPTSNDAIYFRHGSSVSEPADPSLYLGTVDTSAGSTSPANLAPDGTFDQLEVSGDLLDGSGNVIYDQVNEYIIQARLQNDAITINGNSVSLGESVSVGGIDYVQGTEPASPSDSETWIDTSDPARPLYVYSADRGEWVPTFESVPLFVTQEAIGFSESDVSLGHNNTMVSSGALQLLDGVFKSASINYNNVQSVDNWSGFQFDLATGCDDLRVTNRGASTSPAPIRLIDSGGTVLEQGGAPDGGAYTFSGPFPAGTYIVELDTTGNYEHTGPTVNDNPEINITSGTKGGATDANGPYNFTLIESIRRETAGDIKISFSTPADLAAWDRLSWQYDRGDGGLTFDVEVNDGTGWSVHRNDVLPPVSISEVDRTQDVRLVAKFSRQSGGDASPAVSYVARRGER
jgi:hypothetical protein